MEDPLLELRTPQAHRAVDVLKTMDGVLEAAMFGRKVHCVVKDERTAREAITKKLAAHEIQLEDIQQVEPSLEDVFVALVREEGGVVEG
jgi:ABC-2 type transport system ATP-binding protein